MNRKTFGLLVVICLVHFLLGFDINIVSISLPSISKYFNIQPDEATRIVWLYFLILTCFLQIFGKLADIKGFKTLYITGIATFSIFSLLCGISNGFHELTIFRVFQSVGSAILFSLTPALISLYFQDEIKGKIFGINYSFVALGGVVGRFFSGILIEEFSWRAIFIVNLPIALIALIIGIFAIPQIKKGLQVKKFDIQGSAILFLSLFGLLYLLNIINKTDLFIDKIITLLLFLLFLPIFIYWELKISFPLLNLRLLKNKNLTKHLIIFLLIYIFTNGMIFLTPFFLQNIFGFSIILTGFLMTITSIGQVFSGYLSGFLADLVKSKYIIFSGLILTLISLILFSKLLNGINNISFIIILLAIYGISVGLSIPANTKSVMGYAPEYEKGSVSGFMITVIRIGSALGITLYATLFSMLVGEQIHSLPFADGYKYIFLFGALLSLIGAIFSLTLKNNTDKNQ